MDNRRKSKPERQDSEKDFIMLQEYPTPEKTKNLDICIPDANIEESLEAIQGEKDEFELGFETSLKLGPPTTEEE